MLNLNVNAWRSNELLHFHDNVDGMNDAGNIAEDGENDVDPEVFTQADLEKDTERWEDDGKNNA